MAGEYLKYPSNFNARMPFIRFKAYKYLCPMPDIEVLKNLNTREAAALPEIFLYVPGDFTENVTAEWSPESVFQGGTGGNIQSLVASNFADALASNAEGSKILASAEAAAGKLPFPTDINIFRAVQPMQFTLNFNMIPYDSQEGNEIVNIVKIFKTQILPTGNMGANNSLGDFTRNTVLNFPNVWDLEFENMNGIGLEKTSIYESMCLTNVNVSFVSGAEGAAVYHDNNPVSIKLSLGFQSLRKQYLMSGSK